MTTGGAIDRPWLRTDLPLEQRVEALLLEMTLAEKVGQTHQSANVDPITDQELIRPAVSDRLFLPAVPRREKNATRTFMSPPSTRLSG